MIWHSKIYICQFNQMRVTSNACIAGGITIPLLWAAKRICRLLEILLILQAILAWPSKTVQFLAIGGSLI